jgi:hypothetical protein
VRVSKHFRMQGLTYTLSSHAQAHACGYDVHNARVFKINRFCSSFFIFVECSLVFALNRSVNLFLPYTGRNGLRDLLHTSATHICYRHRAPAISGLFWLCYSLRSPVNCYPKRDTTARCSSTKLSTCAVRHELSTKSPGPPVTGPP